MTGKRCSFKLKVIQPVLAGYPNEIYAWRLFVREGDNEKKVLYIKDPEYEKKKKQLLDEGWLEVHYLFPRRAGDVNTIDWRKYFIDKVYYMLKVGIGISQPSNIVITPENPCVGISIRLLGKNKKKPIVFECLESDSEFLVHAVIPETEINKIPKIYAINIGRFKNRGWGLIALIKNF